MRISSLRLIAGGEQVPFQIDHRNPAGHLLPPGDLTLDPQDELVFVCLSDRQTTLHLYGSTEPRPSVVFSFGVKVTSVRDGGDRSHYVLSRAGLRIGIQGAGALDPAAHAPTNHGRGSVVELTWRGRSAIWPSMNWAVYMNGHPFSIKRWRSVKLILDGPVRKVVAVEGVGKVVKDKDGAIVRRVDVTRYFSMFAGVPLYDIEDVLQCEQVQPAWTVTYTDRFFAGRARDSSDVLWDGSTGVLRQFRLADRDIKNNSTGGLVNTKDVSAGWCAWYDTKENQGLAVFYRPAGVAVDRVSFESGWELYSSVNRMSFAYNELRTPRSLWHRFRIIGLTGVGSAQVATEHGLWVDDARLPTTIGTLERRS